ncbi:sensor histidine kinase [Dehalobacter sp. TBBPA1]|uniref:sensor histidine kinase n=1 Tax=Dehalobacter sp. TBBPA1 TaxID=3235037 RepID=UPI0034A38D57
MTIRDFIKEKRAYIVCHLLVAVMTILMLAALNPAGGKAFAAVIGTIYVVGALIPLAMEFKKKYTFYHTLVSSFDRLDRKNLIAEMVSEPDFYEGALLHDILKTSNKACLEEINQYKNKHDEYREYIEMWVHEIKTPISSSKLIAQNNRSEATDSMAEELDAIENYVEQALFYARSSAVEKDYLIKETSLEKPVLAAIKKNAQQLIGTGMSVATDDLEKTVYTDTKWLEFMLHQIILNSLKYANEQDAHLKFTAAERDNRCILAVTDNGLGIPANELPRIFDKGFTGTNGRLRGKSTGMGLYICRRLCEKLGIAISAESIHGSGTTLYLVFPKSSMTDII